MSEEHVQEGGETGVFLVQSQTRPDHCYQVPFGLSSAEYIHPSCSCEDWEKTHRPCKHFCAVFAHCPGWSWHNLPDDYKNNVYFCLDELAVSRSREGTEEVAGTIDPAAPSWRDLEEDMVEHVELSASSLSSVARACREKLFLLRDMTYRIDKVEPLMLLTETLTKVTHDLSKHELTIGDLSAENPNDEQKPAISTRKTKTRPLCRRKRRRGRGGNKCAPSCSLRNSNKRAASNTLLSEETAKQQRSEMVNLLLYPMRNCR